MADEILILDHLSVQDVRDAESYALRRGIATGDELKDILAIDWFMDRAVQAEEASARGDSRGRARVGKNSGPIGFGLR